MYLRDVDLKLLSDFNSVVVILNCEMSRELIHLPVEFIFVHPKSGFATSWGEGINDTVITFLSKA